MDQFLSISITVLGIVAEALAFWGLARLVIGEMKPPRWYWSCTAIAFGIAATVGVVAFQIVWGISQFGHNVLWLLPPFMFLETLGLAGLILAACAIRAIVQWLNWRDNPSPRQSPQN